MSFLRDERKIVLKPEQKKRLDALKKERDKWWDKLPRSNDFGHKFEPLKQGVEPKEAFCAMRDGSVLAVKIWVNQCNFKIVEPQRGTASGRVWPTLEGAYLSLLEKSFDEQRTLLNKLAVLDGAIKSYEQDLNALKSGMSHAE